MLREHPDLSGLRLERTRQWRARHSELIEYRGQSAEGPVFLVLKRIVASADPTRARATVLREFDALRRAREQIGPSASVSLPQPWLVLPEVPALLLGKVPGVPLDVLLRRRANGVTGWFAGGRIVEAVELAGRWLREFHGATAQPDRPFDMALFAADCRKRLDHCRDAGMDREIEGLVWQSVSRAVDRAGGLAERTAARHGDFLPQNVLIDGSRVAVTDLENFADRDGVQVDVGTMSAALRLMTSSPLYSRRTVQLARQRFLQAYGDRADGGLVVLYELLSALAVVAQTGSTVGGAWRAQRMVWLWAALRELAREIESTPLGVAPVRDGDTVEEPRP